MPTFAPLLLSLALLGQAPPPPATAPPSPGQLQVLRTLKVGGEGGWDLVALDSRAARLYVPRGDRVMVLDLAGRSQGEIAATAGVHGVALAPELDRGFTSNGRSNTMTAFRLSTLEVLREVKTSGDNPDAILYDPATRQVFCFNAAGRNATVFDAATLESTGTIPLGGKPELAVTDGKGLIYVNVQNTAELVTLDARALKVTARWSLAPVAQPTGLAFDPVRRRLFSAGGNQLMAVVDAATGTRLQTLPIGAKCDGAAFDPATGRVYAANGEGTLTVIAADRPGPCQVIATVATFPSARTLALDEATHQVFLPAAEFGPAPQALPGQSTRPPMRPDSFRILVVGE